MAQILNINTDGQYNQKQLFSLEGTQYKIHTFWNVRSGWYLSFYDTNDNLILGGIKVMPNSDLLYRHRYKNIIEGILSCVPLTETEDKIGKDNFGEGKVWNIVYFSQEEIGNF